MHILIIKLNQMEKVMKKFEELIEKILSELKEKPVRTGIKAIVGYWIVKKVYELLK